MSVPGAPPVLLFVRSFDRVGRRPGVHLIMEKTDRSIDFLLSGENVWAKLSVALAPVELLMALVPVTRGRRLFFSPIGIDGAGLAPAAGRCRRTPTAASD